MFCPHCGTPNEEYARFCIKCGMEFPHASQAAYAPNQTPKHVRNSAASQQPDVQAEPPLYQAFASDPVPVSTQKQKPKYTVWIISAMILIVLLLTCTVFFLLWHNGSFDRDTTSGTSHSLAMKQEGSSESDPENGSDSEIAVSETAAETTAAPETTTMAETTTAIVTTTTAAEPHRYSVIQSYCTWEEAKSYAEQSGGRLAEIHSEEDWALITAELEKTDVIYGWLGGIEEKNANGAYTFRWLSNSELDFLFNGAGKNYWFPGEPSCIDANSAATVEPYLQIWKIKEQWSLNDNSNQALQVYSSKPYRFGYVVEYNW